MFARIVWSLIKDNKRGKKHRLNSQISKSSIQDACWSTLLSKHSLSIRLAFLPITKSYSWVLPKYPSSTELRLLLKQQCLKAQSVQKYHRADNRTEILETLVCRQMKKLVRIFCPRTCRSEAIICQLVQRFVAYLKVSA